MLFYSPKKYINKWAKTRIKILRCGDFTKKPFCTEKCFSLSAPSIILSIFPATSLQMLS